MKLAAIYNVWDGLELLGGSINCVKNHVDLIVIVFSEVSNYNELIGSTKEVEDTVRCILSDLKVKRWEIHKYTPCENTAWKDEINKRNIGISIVRNSDCSHFLHIDCDEYYHPEEFEKGKELFVKSGVDGSVCKMKTYFKNPILQLEKEEGYHVPFIHKITPAGTSYMMPYQFWVDPTRRYKAENVIELPIKMHHYSWVRINIERKARNSSASTKIQQGTILKDYHKQEVGPGFYVKDFDSKLIEVPNYFNIQI